MVKYAAIDGVACLMLGLGLYGKFAVNNDAFMPLLNNSDLVNGLLVLGAITLAVSGSKLMGLMLQKAKLNNIKN